MCGKAQSEPALCAALYYRSHLANTIKPKMRCKAERVRRPAKRARKLRDQTFV